MRKLFIYVDDSIPDYKIKEEIDFIKYLISHYSMWTVFDMRVKGLFPSLRAKALETDFKYAIPMDFENKRIHKIKHSFDNGLLLVEVKKTNLTEMFKNFNATNCMVATNNYRYEGYKDLLGKNFISVPNVTPEHLMRKALLRTLSYIRETGVKENIVKQYLLGSN